MNAGFYRLLFQDEDVCEMKSKAVITTHHNCVTEQQIFVGLELEKPQRPWLCHEFALQIYYLTVLHSDLLLTKTLNQGDANMNATGKESIYTDGLNPICNKNV